MKQQHTEKHGLRNLFSVYLRKKFLVHGRNTQKIDWLILDTIPGLFCSACLRNFRALGVSDVDPSFPGNVLRESIGYNVVRCPEFGVRRKN